MSAVASERREWSALSAGEEAEDEEARLLRADGAEVERGSEEDDEAEGRERDDALSAWEPAADVVPRDEVDPPADARRRRFSPSSSPRDLSPARDHPTLSSSRCLFLPISPLTRSISLLASSQALPSSSASLLPLCGVLIASNETLSSASPNRRLTSSALSSLRTMRAFLSRKFARRAREAEKGSDQRDALCDSRAWRRSAVLWAAARCVTVFSREANGSGGAVEVEAALSAVRDP